MTGSRRDFATPVSEGDACAPQIPRRRARWLIVPSGWVLLISAFLPAIRFCHGSLPMAVVPFAWPPFLLGLMVAIAATSAGARAAARSYAGVLAWYIRLNVLAFGAWFLFEVIESRHVEPAIPVAWAYGLFLWFVTAGPRNEVSLARISTFGTATVAGLAALLLPDPDTMWGVYVTFGAACLQMIGAIWWWIEAHADSR